MEAEVTFIFLPTECMEIQCSFFTVTVTGIFVHLKIVKYFSRHYQILIFFLIIMLHLDMWCMTSLMWVEKKQLSSGECETEDSCILYKSICKPCGVIFFILDCSLLHLMRECITVFLK